MPKDKARADIESVQKPLPKEIPFDLVEHPGRKTTRLLATASLQNQLKGRHRWHDYEFKVPVFVSFIILHCKEYSEYSDFDFALDLFDGKKISLKASPKAGVVKLPVSMICKSISMRPPAVFFSDPTLIELKIFGNKVDELKNIVDFISAFDSKKEEALAEVDAAYSRLDDRAAAVNALEAQRNDIRSQIQSVKSQHAREMNKLDKARSDNLELTAKHQALEAEHRQITRQSDEMNSEISRLSGRRDETKRTISELEDQLKSLKENVNLFPSELSEFVKQGQQNITVYMLFASVPIAIIAVMFGMLISGAANLTTIVTGNEKINLLAIAVSRAPFIFVSIAIITACFYLARMFVLEIIRVNRQRLNLTKISIIAKDISFSLENELSMDQDEIYAKRLKLKMDMMRDHLRDYLGKDFEPNLPDIIRGGSAILLMKDGDNRADVESQKSAKEGTE